MENFFTGFSIGDTKVKKVKLNHMHTHISPLASRAKESKNILWSTPFYPSLCTAYIKKVERKNKLMMTVGSRELYVPKYSCSQPTTMWQHLQKRLQLTLFKLKDCLKKVYTTAVDIKGKGVKKEFPKFKLDFILLLLFLIFFPFVLLNIYFVVCASSLISSPQLLAPLTFSCYLLRKTTDNFH